MAKTKVEAGADQAKAIADAVEAAVAAWSPIVALGIKGVRLLVRKARGENVDAELKAFEVEAGRADGFLDQMDARGDEYKRRRALETGGQ